MYTVEDLSSGVTYAVNGYDDAIDLAVQLFVDSVGIGMADNLHFEGTPSHCRLLDGDDEVMEMWSDTWTPASLV